MKNIIKRYKNLDQLAAQNEILAENRGKSGVYIFTNKINNKTYVGSSVNISARFLKYFNINSLIKSRMLISLALLKYGHKNFVLDILEYCSKEDTIKREQYYLDNIKPEYNILNSAGSSFGYRHT